MNRVHEPEPARGVLLPVVPGVHRVVARNAGGMTNHGTNTYLLTDAGGVTVIDPGPDDAAHVADLTRLAPGLITAIVLTHTHTDHWGATAALRAATDAPVHGWHAPAATGFTPDVMLQDGDTVAGLRVIHTPGHAADHICLAREDGVLFSGDHVMGWSTSVVAPPGGDMAAYFASLERLIGRTDTLYLPGHGPPVPSPQPYVKALLHHRRMREAAILSALGPQPVAIGDLTARLYPGIDPSLRRVAEANVGAHLNKLIDEAQVERSGEQHFVRRESSRHSRSGPSRSD